MQPIGSASIAASSGLNYHKVIREWVVNEVTIRLIEDESLFYQTIIQGKISSTLPIPNDKNDSIDLLISYLKECEVVVDENGKVHFLRKKMSLDLEDTKLSVLAGTTNLIWSIYHKTSKTTSFFDFHKVTIPSYRCHSETAALIESIKAKSLDPNYIQCLKNDFTVARVLSAEFFEIQKEKLNILLDCQKYIIRAWTSGNISGYISGFGGLALSCKKLASLYQATSLLFGANAVGVGLGAYTVYVVGSFTFSWLYAIPSLAGMYFSKAKEESVAEKIKELEEKERVLSAHNSSQIAIEPFSVSSHIDPRVRVSKFIWAVTLVTHSGSLGNHTLIVTEGLGYRESLNFKGVKDGEYFMCMSHYSGKYALESKIIQADTLEYETRAPIWKIEQSRVVDMLQDIEKNISNPPALSRLGSDSIFSNPGEESCFTWARKKLKIVHIQLGKSSLSKIITIPKNFTQNKESYLYQEYDERI